MHQQPGDRSCAQEAIGGNHYGPVIVYMSRVTDAKTASGSSVSWFKVAEMGLVSNNPNYWGVQVLNVSPFACDLIFTCRRTHTCLG